jgi:hypothetical protein
MTYPARNKQGIKCHICLKSGPLFPLPAFKFFPIAKYWRFVGRGDKKGVRDNKGN